MILKILQFLLVSLLSEKQKPVNSLHKRGESRINLKGVNWTFILLTFAMILFFATIWIFQMGNSYPNDLMSGNLNI